MADRPSPPNGEERIPFYRNVKLIGGITQAVFLIVAVVAVALLVRNVQSGLGSSGLTFSFDFLDNRAGFALSETPISYEASDSYLRALGVGIANTLQIAILGVILTSLLGVVIGVMRLSDNWLLRQIATGFVELLRNTPLPVQLIFWYFAVILAIPPLIRNSWRVGDFMLSQVGLALPALRATPRFGAWLPWVIAAAVAFVGLYLWRRRAIEQSDRPGNPWPIPIIAAIVIAGGGYLPGLFTATVADGATAELRTDRGRGSVFIDADDDGALDDDERTLAGVPVLFRVAEGQLETNSQNLTESQRVVESSFRFPEVKEAEAASIEVAFADPESADGLSIHFERYPSVGRIYRDKDGDGAFDRNEVFEMVDGERQTFNGIELVMIVEDFERRLVSGRDGRLLFPPFLPVGGAEPEPSSGGGAAAGGGGGLGDLFGSPVRGADDEGDVESTVEFLPVPPLVYSAPTIPRSEYFGGVTLSGAFLALLLGLVIYTSAFVAEIVRGGIQAVNKGQTEAARALGLGEGQVFRLVVFPQAMRIILPPMISQYLNLTKNSSLAILVTFEDFFNVSNIVGNQTGQFIPVYLIILVGYLGISLVFSLILNIVNNRMALVER